MATREEVLNGDLVTLFREDGQPQFCYKLGGGIYGFSYNKDLISYKDSDEERLVWFEGGERFMEFIRSKRRTAKTPYSSKPLPTNELTPRLLEALRFVKKSGGSISRKMLCDHFDISPQAAKRLMNQMVNEAILFLDERAMAGYLTNAADNVEL